jgi:hypothetical protein
MDASTRLYKRLGEIPEDPNDPESLDDLVVCAFGAFERYYVCWKTKGGEYKQGALTHQQHLDFLMIVPQLDGYDSLPPSETGSIQPTAQHATLPLCKSSSGVEKSTSRPTSAENRSTKNLKSRNQHQQKTKRSSTEKPSGGREQSPFYARCQKPVYDQTVARSQ